MRKRPWSGLAIGVLTVLLFVAPSSLIGCGESPKSPDQRAIERLENAGMSSAQAEAAVRAIDARVARHARERARRERKREAKFQKRLKQAARDYRESHKSATTHEPNGHLGCPAGAPNLAPGGVGVRVSCENFGSKWPLTVAGGYLRCESKVVAGYTVQSVVFTAPDGTEYGVNGSALDQGYREIDPIWKKSGEPYAPRVNIGPLIDRGLSI